MGTEKLKLQELSELSFWKKLQEIYKEALEAENIKKRVNNVIKNIETIDTGSSLEEENSAGMLLIALQDLQATMTDYTCDTKKLTCKRVGIEIISPKELIELQEIAPNLSDEGQEQLATMLLTITGYKTGLLPFEESVKIAA